MEFLRVLSMWIFWGRVESWAEGQGQSIHLHETASFWWIWPVSEKVSPSVLVIEAPEEAGKAGFPLWTPFVYFVNFVNAQGRKLARSQPGELPSHGPSPRPP